MVLIGLGIIFLIIYCICLNHDPNLVNFKEKMLKPSFVHPFGTDHLGRDMLTRILLGSIYTVGYSGLALIGALIIGIPVGIIAGFIGGKIDRFFMRIADAFLSFPDTIIAIILSGLLGPNFINLLIAVVLVKWVSYARLVRSTVILEKQKEYVMQAKLNGLNSFQIMKKHLFPHVMGNVFVLASLDLGKIILLLSALSYIGLGAQPPTPEWGAMLNEAKANFQSNSLLMIFPGIAIITVVLFSNLVGDYLRDKYDVKREG
nr:nickel transporter permease [Niallia nealsonii]